MIQTSATTFLQVKNQCPCQMEVPAFFLSWPNLLPNKCMTNWNHFWKKNQIKNSFCWISFPPKRQTFPNMLFLSTTVDIISKSMQDSLSFVLHLVPKQSFDSYLHPLRVPISSAKAQTMCWTDSSGPVTLSSQEWGTAFATTTFQREGSSACTALRQHWGS